jgi:hypothetical protein
MTTKYKYTPYSSLTEDKIVCQNCGWSWLVKDGGDDLYVCHKCFHDNQDEYSNFSVDVGAIIQAGTQVAGATAGAVGKGQEAKASKEAGKTILQREIDTRCGKDKSRAISKKKRNEYLACKQNVIRNYDIERSQANTGDEQRRKVQSRMLAQKQKDNRNRTYVVVGILALVIGFLAYKKFKK